MLALATPLATVPLAKAGRMRVSGGISDCLDSRDRVREELDIEP